MFCHQVRKQPDSFHPRITEDRDLTPEQVGKIAEAALREKLGG